MAGIARNKVADVSEPIVPMPIIASAASIYSRWARQLKKPPFVGLRVIYVVKTIL
jgi:hypothetical protein